MKVVIVSSLAYSLTNFRGALIRQMIGAGHEVIACAPDRDRAAMEELAAMGARFCIVPMARASLNPVSDLRTLIALVRLLRRERPDVVFAYTQKPIIYTGIAHRLVRTGTYFPMVTGLGYAFSEANGHRWLRPIVAWLYRVGVASASSVIVYNRDDEHELQRHGVLGERRKAILVPGSGVDTALFPNQPLPPRGPIFLLIARLLKDKGLHEYAAAARLVAREYPEARFKLLGPFDANPASITAADLERWTQSKTIEYLGETRDVRPTLAGCSVFVLPSYREGMPRAVLEAMATGRAIITTDAPGCRDLVSHDDNGFLVPVRDVDGLADAMRRFCREPELISRMGARSRQIVQDKYAVERVNSLLMMTLGLLPSAQKSETYAQRR